MGTGGCTLIGALFSYSISSLTDNYSLLFPGVNVFVASSPPLTPVVFRHTRDAGNVTC